jgi:hypothetical protein
LTLRVASISSFLADPFLATAFFAIDPNTFALAEALVVKCLSDAEVGCSFVVVWVYWWVEVSGNELELVRQL